jgi:hypothetical protein
MRLAGPFPFSTLSMVELLALIQEEQIAPWRNLLPNLLRHHMPVELYVQIREE